MKRLAILGIVAAGLLAGCSAPTSRSTTTTLPPPAVPPSPGPVVPTAIGLTYSQVVANLHDLGFQITSVSPPCPSDTSVVTTQTPSPGGPATSAGVSIGC